LKAIAPLLVFALAVSAGAQTTPTTTPAKPATTATAKSSASTTAKSTATHKTATTAASSSGLPANIPVVKALTKSLYSLKYQDISIGNGPLAESSVLGKSQADSKIQWYTVHYTGWLAKDGTKFDSSVDRGTPITFPYGVGKVIPGWDTAFEGMHVGGKRRIFVPYQLAYGANGRPPVIPAKSDLIFDVELVAVSDKPPAPPADANKPADAGKPGASTPPNPTKAAPAAPAGSAAPATPAAKPATPAPAATATQAAKPATPAPAAAPVAKPDQK